MTDLNKKRPGSPQPGIATTHAPALTKAEELL
jgi:hypothetical protein